MEPEDQIPEPENQIPEPENQAPEPESPAPESLVPESLVPESPAPAPLDTPAGPPTRILAFDVGDRRIGLALSDPLGYTAQPLFTLHRTRLKDDLKSIARVLRRHGPITEAVVGNPLYMSGDLSPQAIRAQQFADSLRTELGLTVHLWDERLTTTQAHRHLDALGHSRQPGAHGVARKQIIDQVAAVLILQAFLEARANERARAANELSAT